MQEFEAAIIRNEHIASKIYLIELSAPKIAEELLPGQFVQVMVSNGTAPFLRRTFSVCGVDISRGKIQLLVDVVGQGTEILCSLNRGGLLNIIGPLGKGFDTTLSSDSSAIMVAGGTGAAPLIFLSEYFSAKGLSDVTFLMGGKDAKTVKFSEMLLNERIQIMVATEDGSAGFHGLVTDLLKTRLDIKKPSSIFTCGPHPMMKAVAEIASQNSILCQVSLEERMACGIGACLGCAVEMNDGSMVRSCVEGPVFNSHEVIL